MDKNGRGGTKKKIALAAAVVGIVLTLLTAFFIQTVKTRLWEQSVNTIMESTQQGCNTLRIQLNKDFESMSKASENLKNYSQEQKELLERLIGGYSQIGNITRLYLDNGDWITGDGNKDTETEKILAETDRQQGIIDPHISSETGVHVFDLFVEITLKDGTRGFLVKEYEIDSIADTFSLSFYNDSGFSYVVDSQGDVLIRPSHPASNKTVQNLFDMLPASENDQDNLDTFKLSLEESRTGWAVFNYKGEGMVFCYVPLELKSDWFLISIIPEDVVNEQTNEILARSMVLIVCIIFGISLLVILYIYYAGRTNRKLRTQAEYTEHLYNAIPEAVALLSVEYPYNIIQMNQEGQRLLGYGGKSSGFPLKGTKLQDIVHPKDYDRMGRLFEKVSVNEEKIILENRMLKADGSYIWTAGIIEETRDENGSPILIAAFHDITKEKMAEEALENEKRQERLTLVGAISNAYPVIISMNLTKDTIHYIYIRQGLLLGIGEQTSYTGLYKNMLPTIHPDNEKEFQSRFALKSLREVLGTDKKEVFMDMRQKLTDDRYHWTSTQIIYVDNPYSEDKLAILISRRIDEQRHAEEQRRQALQTALDNARAASEAKGRFLSNMSHDIRTPMNAIVGMTAIAEAHLDDREKVEGCLKKIGLSSRHLLSLINDVLDVSKIESGKLSLREEPFDLEELAPDIIELVRPQAIDKGLGLEVHLGPLRNGKVIGDSLRIRQVFINILSNAVKYTPQGGKIKIRLYQENSILKGYDTYVFQCSDTGPGMSREFVDRLFEPFERAQDFTTSKIPGTGLGMAITKNLVDLMNGEIQVDSRLSKGSAFTVTLPLKQQDEPGREQSIEQKQSIDDISSMDYSDKRILLVEDNELNREIARELITGITDIQIDEAQDGEEAVEMITASEEGYYNLVLMDIQMPRMDGYTATRAIRALHRRDAAGIPIIAMTANAFEEDIRASVRSGMNAHFAKPIEMDALKKILSQYL